MLTIKLLLAAIEASSPRKEPKCLLFPSQKTSFEGMTKFNWIEAFSIENLKQALVFDNVISYSAAAVPGESSFTAGERMCESVKVVF